MAILRLIALLLLCNAAALAGAPVAINPMDYVAVCNGASDDTTALQNAESVAEAQHLPMFLPDGCGTQGLNVTGAVKIEGSGSAAAQLRLLGLVGVSISTPSAVVIEGIYFRSASAGQTGIKLDSPTSYNTLSVFRDLVFDNTSIGLETENSAYWTVDNCTFGGPQMMAGVIISNANRPDAGNSVITHSKFITPPGGTNSNAILQYSSGGLYISDTMFNGFTWGYQLYLSAGVGTANLSISNTTFEHMTAGAVVLWRQGGGSFGGITISGILVTNSPWAILKLDSTYGWLSQVNISGCNGCAGRISLSGVSNVSMSGIN